MLVGGLRECKKTGSKRKDQSVPPLLFRSKSWDITQTSRLRVMCARGAKISHSSGVLTSALAMVTGSLVIYVGTGVFLLLKNYSDPREPARRQRSVVCLSNRKIQVALITPLAGDIQDSGYSPGFSFVTTKSVKHIGVLFLVLIR